MKRILMATIVLLAFALALTLTQVSCSKSTAQTIGTTNPTPIGKVLYEGIVQASPQNILSIFICNYDGSNAHQINVTGLPAGYGIDNGVKLSPDGKTLFFIAGNGNQSYLFSANADGSNLKQLTPIPANSTVGATVDGA